MLSLQRLEDNANSRRVRLRLKSGPHNRTGATMSWRDSG